MVSPDDVIDWEKLEDAFRLWAFNTYYARSFASEPDLTLRFAKALVESSQPIPDRSALLTWRNSKPRRPSIHRDRQKRDGDQMEENNGE